MPQLALLEPELSEGNKSLDGLNEWAQGHEKLCAARYQGIDDKLRMIITGMIGLVLALMGWMAVQLYTLEPLRIAAASSSTVTHTQSTTVQQSAKP